MFYNILERKNAFLGYKNKKFKISKNWGFSKWVSLCFVQKWATSPSFFMFGNIGQEKFFLRYSGSKKRCFLEFVRLYFCRLHCTFFYSENQIKIFSGLICPKSHLKNKISFFDKKRGLILLESFIFSTFLKVFLSCLKTTLFYWECLKTIFLSLISKKQEAWTNPFGKFRLLGFFRNLAFSWLEFNIFYSQYWKIIFSCLICLKNTHEKRLDFFTKTVD